MSASARRAAFVIVLGSSSSLGASASCVPRERPDTRDEQPSGAEARAVNAASPAAPPKSSRPARNNADEARGSQDNSGAPPETSADPSLSSVFTDDFNRPELGAAWRATSSAWSIAEGMLCGENARNHPVWLARRLPINARIEFTARSSSTQGDIKAEFWGDGRSFAAGQSYTDATSYLTIFGGWRNTFHVLARIDEHAPDRREIKVLPGAADFIVRPVVPNQSYQFHVERRDGRTVEWRVDGLEIAAYADDEPLTGAGHEHFGFNNWQVRVCFDDLRVTPLPE